MHASQNTKTAQTTLRSPTVARLLDRLFRAAEETDPAIFARAQESRLAAGKSEREITNSDLDRFLGEAYMPVPREMGDLLYILARAQRSRTIVEFGTSFAISTIHLAAAVRDNGGGRVITTELNAQKVQRARQNLEESGLGDLVEVREGDALVTLRDLDLDLDLDSGGGIDLLLLDGWKDLYLPVLRLLEPRLRPGALVIADDLDIQPELHKPYLDYVRAPESGYVSVELPLGDRIEVSLRTPAWQRETPPG